MIRSNITFFAALFFASATLLSCRHNVNIPKNQDTETSDNVVLYENAIDSIIHNTLASDCFTAVYDYLIKNPDFLTASENIGYHNLIYGESSKVMIWKELDGIRIYSIPEESNYTTYCHNIVQIKCGDKIRIDTTFLNENGGWMEDLFEIKGQDSKNYYILKTCIYIAHQGEISREHINAFSVEDGNIVKEKLFVSKGNQFDEIDVECGGQRYSPLQYDNIVLISTEYLFDKESPMLVVADINERCWPTGYGLIYKWTGFLFEDAGQCYYDADGYVRDE